MADIVRTYYHRVHGAQQMYTIDGDAATSRHPNEWSTKPWTDAAALAAEEAQREADKRDRDTGGRPKDRVPDGHPDHAEAVKDPPPKPSGPVDQGLASGILPAGSGAVASEDVAQPAVERPGKK